MSKKTTTPNEPEIVMMECEIHGMTEHTVIPYDEDYELPPYVYYTKEDGDETQNIPLTQDTDEYLAYMNHEGPEPDGFEYLMDEDQADLLLYHFLLRRNEIFSTDGQSWDGVIEPVCNISWEPFWTWNYEEARGAMDGPKDFYRTLFGWQGDEDEMCYPHDVGIHTGAEAREFLKSNADYVSDKNSPYYGKHITGLGDMAKDNTDCYCLSESYIADMKYNYPTGPNGETEEEWGFMGYSYDGVPKKWVEDKKRFALIYGGDSLEEVNQAIDEIREFYGTQGLTGQHSPIIDDYYA